ncbi:MAG: magnesium chelatase subunit H [Deltaproteobacteria bacterium]|nr:magnesium chelatase subunit H [Deltaproteobacteria bacterium]
MQITSIIGNFTYSKPLAEVAEILKKKFKGKVVMTNHFCLRHQAYSKKQLEEMEEDIKNSDIIFLAMVFDEAVLRIIEKYTKEDKTLLILASVGEGMRLTRLGKFCVEDLITTFTDSKVAKVFKLLKGLTGRSSSMEVRKLLSMADNILKVLRFGKWKDAYNYVQAWKYFFHGGRENTLNMFLLILSEYYGFKTEYKPPEEIPGFYIAHPRAGKIFTSLEEYLKWYELPYWMPTNGSKKKKRPLVGLLFYSDRYQNEDSRDLEAVIEKLEKKGIGVIPAMSTGLENLRTIKTFFSNNGKPPVDALISFLYFRMEGGPLGGNYEAFEQLCRQMNIPLINYISMGYSTNEDWRERDEGLFPMETNLCIILPELDGLIEGVLIAGGKEPPKKGRNMVRIMTPLEERVDHAVARTANWLKLKYTANKDKKVAFILFNYPPGKDTIGSAGNLDTFESLIRLLDRMREEGYTVSGYPRTRHEFIRLITKKNVVNQSNWTSITKVKDNSFKIPLAEYKKWFAELPETCQKEMIDTWEEPPGSLMADEEYLYVPGLQFGNIFIGFQPERGAHADPSKTYHDTALPPHHQYYAFYRFIERVFQADVALHFGTHGTLEFLPGKQVALSESCFPDIFMGSLPHLYFYTCSNPSEAMIAKRRTYAALVDYMTPPMIVSDLYGTFAEMETDIHNYYNLKEQSPVRAKELKEKILNDAKENNLVDIEAEDVDLNKLYNDLSEMKGSMMTKGVHVMGRALTDDELVDYVLGIVRFDRGEISSVHKSLSLSYGFDWDEIRKNPSKIMKGGKVAGVICDQINQESRDLLSEVLVQKSPIKKAVKKHVRKKINRETTKNLTATLEFSLGLGESLENNKEIDHMVRALNAEYISPGLGGNPIRSPGVIPTGRNPYQFNPDLIPTPLACRRGEEVGRQVIKCYQEENEGRFPETVAVVLWGFETMKTQGETIGEIFHLLGIRPRRAGVGDMVGLDPIPLEELGRPRLDVAVEICGIFRDTFPVVLRYLDRAFRLVAALNEPDDKNFVKKHAKAIQKALEKEGVPKEQAKQLSVARVFGPSASNYGTDVTDLIETSEWEDPDQIADLHLAKMSHLYGDAYHAESNLSTFKEVLDTVDVVAQVRDNEEYGIADLDHYYEFLGGLSSSVESVRKSRSTSERKTRPVVLVADSTKDKIKTMNIKKTINYEVRTKLLNPNWMKGQMDSGYKGVKNLSNRIEYLVGWQATTSGSVDNWVWSEMADKYVFNEEVRKKMMQENIWAVEDQLRRLMEAYQRGMWDATDEEIEKLKQIYLELEAEIEELEE